MRQVKKPQAFEDWDGDIKRGYYPQREMDAYLSAFKLWLITSIDYHAEKGKTGKNRDERSGNTYFKVAYQGILDMLNEEIIKFEE